MREGVLSAVVATILTATATGQQTAGKVAELPTPAVQTITLSDALHRAEANEPTFVTAVAENRALALERANARAALLPSAVSHNQAIYTEPNGAPASRIGQTTNAPSPIFIANNAVREYAFQGLFNETIGLQQVGAIRLADATAARSAAEAEIARRGLAATVVSLYYGIASADAKLAATAQAKDETERFLDITKKREAAREVAHADVLKAQLQFEGRERELQDARLSSQKAYLELGVLLFPDPSTAFSTAPIDSPTALLDFATVQTSATQNNAELRSALASLRMSEAESFSAKAALLPDLAVNVTYGIDATTIASSQIDPDGSRIKNLGYSGSATLDVPLWDWLTGERKIRQAHIRQEAARAGVTAAQRRLVANLKEFYSEAETALRQLGALDASVRDAQESLRLTNLRYTDGESTALEVVDAENTLTSIQISRADGALRYQLALAQLQTLTGTF